MTAFPHLPAFPHAALAALNADSAQDRSPLARHMYRGGALHQAGLAEYALNEFEQALLLAPRDANAASARASVLLQMRRPEAAWQGLQPHRQTLETTAEGCCNVATCAVAVGERALARTLYRRALALDANNLRALSGMSGLAQTDCAWDEALPPAVRWAALRPQDLQAQQHLIDTLLLARRPSDALRACVIALQQMPGTAALHLRQGLAQACLGSWDEAQRSMSGLKGIDAQATLNRLGFELASGNAPLDVVALYIQYASQTTAQAQWIYDKALPDVLRALLRSPDAASSLVWRCARPAALATSMVDTEIAALHQHADAALSRPRPVRRAENAIRASSDDRLRIGFFVPRLSALDDGQWLLSQLDVYDAARFALHIYATTPSGDERALALVSPRVACFVETAHMTDEELEARLALDSLDLLLDLACDTADARPEVMAGHPAAVMVRDGRQYPLHPPAPYDYGLSDVFVHAGANPAASGALVRLPFSNSIAPIPAKGPPRAADGSAAVQWGADVSFEALDPETFKAWMQALTQAPKARLHLPAYPNFVRLRLRQQAASYSVAESRLYFAANDGADAENANLPHRWPDIALDPLRRSVPTAVARALGAGIPVLSCAGAQTRARAGAAILIAAGMDECVVADANAYVARLVGWSQDPATPALLRQQLAASRSLAPWWDRAARAREIESAWFRMITKARNGQPPAPFDIAVGEMP